MGGEGGSSPWTPPETDSNSKNPGPNMGTGELYPHKGYLMYLYVSIVHFYPKENQGQLWEMSYLFFPFFSSDSVACSCIEPLLDSGMHLRV